MTTCLTFKGLERLFYLRSGVIGRSAQKIGMPARVDDANAGGQYGKGFSKVV